MQDPKSAIIMPADILASYGARPSAGTIWTPYLDNIFVKVSCAVKYVYALLLISQHFTKLWGRFCEILQHLKY